VPYRRFIRDVAGMSNGPAFAGATLKADTLTSSLVHIALFIFSDLLLMCVPKKRSRKLSDRPGSATSSNDKFKRSAYVEQFRFDLLAVRAVPATSVSVEQKASDPQFVDCEFFLYTYDGNACEGEEGTVPCPTPKITRPSTPDSPHRSTPPLPTLPTVPEESATPQADQAPQESKPSDVKTQDTKVASTNDQPSEQQPKVLSDDELKPRLLVKIRLENPAMREALLTQLEDLQTSLASKVKVTRSQRFAQWSKVVLPQM